MATAVSPDMMCGSARNQSKRLPRPSANPQAQKKAGRVRTLGLVHTTCCVLQYITLFVVTVFSTPKPLWVESDSTMFRGCGGAPDAKLLLISLDLEHTGWGAYTSDMMQLAADAHLFSSGNPSLVAAVLDGEPWTFSADVQTNQKLNLNLPSNFHHSFPFSRLHDGLSLKAVMDSFENDVLRLKKEHQVDQVWLCGHNAFKCDAVVLEFHLSRHSMSFEDLLVRLGVVGWIDSLTLIPRTELKNAASKKLGDLYKFVTDGVALENAHDALADVGAQSRVMKHPSVLSLLASTEFIGRTTRECHEFIRRQKTSHFSDTHEKVVPSFTSDEMNNQEVIEHSQLVHCTVDSQILFRNRNPQYIVFQISTPYLANLRFII